MIEAERVTGGAGVPTIWNDLLHHLDDHEADVSSCRMLMVGGSAAPPALIRAFADRYDIDIVHVWGMTEMSPVGSLALPPQGVEPGTEEYWRYKSSQGRLLYGVEGRLVGPDGSIVPSDGESVGELEVRGPWITDCYYANGTETGDRPGRGRREVRRRVVAHRRRRTAVAQRLSHADGPGQGRHQVGRRVDQARSTWRTP